MKNLLEKARKMREEVSKNLTAEEAVKSNATVAYGKAMAKITREDGEVNKTVYTYTVRMIEEEKAQITLKCGENSLPMTWDLKQPYGFLSVKKFLVGVDKATKDMLVADASETARQICNAIVRKSKEEGLPFYKIFIKARKGAADAKGVKTEKSSKAKSGESKGKTKIKISELTYEQVAGFGTKTLTAIGKHLKLKEYTVEAITKKLNLVPCDFNDDIEDDLDDIKEDFDVNESKSDAKSEAAATKEEDAIEDIKEESDETKKLKAKVSELTKECIRLEKVNKGQASEIFDLKLSNGDLEKSVKSLKKERKDLTAQVSSLTAENEEITNNFNSLIEEGEELAIKVISLEEKNEELADEIERLKKALEAEKANVKVKEIIKEVPVEAVKEVVKEIPVETEKEVVEAPATSIDIEAIKMEIKSSLKEELLAELRAELKADVETSKPAEEPVKKVKEEVELTAAQLLTSKELDEMTYRELQRIGKSLKLGAKNKSPRAKLIEYINEALGFKTEDTSPEVAEDVSSLVAEDVEVEIKVEENEASTSTEASITEEVPHVDEELFADDTTDNTVSITEKSDTITDNTVTDTTDDADTITDDTVTIDTNNTVTDTTNNAVTIDTESEVDIDPELDTKSDLDLDDEDDWFDEDEDDYLDNLDDEDEYTTMPSGIKVELTAAQKAAAKALGLDISSK